MTDFIGGTGVFIYESGSPYPPPVTNLVMKSCGASDCYLGSNWFGASSSYPRNKSNTFDRCKKCNEHNYKSPEVIQSMIRSFKL